MTYSLSQPRQTGLGKLSPPMAVKRAVLEALHEGGRVPGGGEEILRVEEILSEYLGGANTLAVSSGTMAVEIALRPVSGPGMRWCYRPTTGALRRAPFCAAARSRSSPMLIR